MSDSEFGYREEMRRFANNITCSILLGLWFTVSSSAQSYEFEEGFCEHKTDPDRYEAISQALREADLTVLCSDTDKFFVPTAKSITKAKYITRSELEALASAKRDKRLLAIYFRQGGPSLAKFIPREIERVKKEIKDLTPFISSLGYARVLMLTLSSNSCCRGYYVVEDRILTPATKVEGP